MSEESEEFEERAAIREYLGGFPRREAERLAREDIRQRRKRECLEASGESRRKQ